MTNRVRHFLAVAALFAFSLTGCKAENGLGTRKIVSAVPSATEIPLTLEGFNYTNRYIDDFTVDGHSGGNLRVSGHGGGGGGSACCVSYFPNSKPRAVTIRWQVGGCIFLSKSSDGTETFENTYHFFKEANVKLEQEIKEPKYLSVHFYPDGTVQAALSGTVPTPRLLLEKGRVDRSKYPRCPDDRKPS